MGFGLIGETELALVSNIAAAQLCISKVKNLLPERERQMAEFKDLDDNIFFISQAS